MRGLRQRTVFRTAYFSLTACMVAIPSTLYAHLSRIGFGLPSSFPLSRRMVMLSPSTFASWATEVVLSELEEDGVPSLKADVDGVSFSESSCQSQCTHGHQRSASVMPSLCDLPLSIRSVLRELANQINSELFNRVAADTISSSKLSTAATAACDWDADLSSPSQLAQVSIVQDVLSSFLCKLEQQQQRNEEQSQRHEEFSWCSACMMHHVVNGTDNDAAAKHTVSVSMPVQRKATQQQYGSSAFEHFSQCFPHVKISPMRTQRPFRSARRQQVQQGTLLHHAASSDALSPLWTSSCSPDPNAVESILDCVAAGYNTVITWESYRSVGADFVNHLTYHLTNHNYGMNLSGERAVCVCVIELPCEEVFTLDQFIDNRMASVCAQQQAGNEAEHSLRRILGNDEIDVVVITDAQRLRHGVLRSLDMWLRMIRKVPNYPFAGLQVILLIDPLSGAPDLFASGSGIGCAPPESMRRFLRASDLPLAVKLAEQAVAVLKEFQASTTRNVFYVSGTREIKDGVQALRDAQHILFGAKENTAEFTASGAESEEIYFEGWSWYFSLRALPVSSLPPNPQSSMSYNSALEVARNISFGRDVPNCLLQRQLLSAIWRSCEASTNEMLQASQKIPPLVVLPTLREAKRRSSELSTLHRCFFQQPNCDDSPRCDSCSRAVNCVTYTPYVGLVTLAGKGMWTPTFFFTPIPTATDGIHSIIRSVRVAVKSAVAEAAAVAAAAIPFKDERRGIAVSIYQVDADHARHSKQWQDLDPIFGLRVRVETHGFVTEAAHVAAEVLSDLHACHFIHLCIRMKTGDRGDGRQQHRYTMVTAQEPHSMSFPNWIEAKLQSLGSMHFPHVTLCTGDVVCLTRSITVPVAASASAAQSPNGNQQSDRAESAESEPVMAKETAEARTIPAGSRGRVVGFHVCSNNDLDCGIAELTSLSSVLSKPVKMTHSADSPEALVFPIVDFENLYEATKTITTGVVAVVPFIRINVGGTPECHHYTSEVIGIPLVQGWFCAVSDVCSPLRPPGCPHLLRLLSQMQSSGATVSIGGENPHEWLLPREDVQVSNTMPAPLYTALGFLGGHHFERWWAHFGPGGDSARDNREPIISMNIAGEKAAADEGNATLVSAHLFEQLCARSCSSGWASGCAAMPTALWTYRQPNDIDDVFADSLTANEQIPDEDGEAANYSEDGRGSDDCGDGPAAAA